MKRLEAAAEAIATARQLEPGAERLPQLEEQLARARAPAMDGNTGANA